MRPNLRRFTNEAIQKPELVSTVPVKERDRAQARGFVVARLFALIFYFLEYAVRSSPSVMIPQLAAAFRTTALGVGSILVLYCYIYSITSLVAGAALDHLGAKRPVPIGAAILAAGCLLFSVGTAAMGPYFAHLFAKSLETTTNHTAHFREAVWFCIACCIAAIIVSMFLRETGHGKPPAAAAHD